MSRNEPCSVQTKWPVVLPSVILSWACMHFLRNNMDTVNSILCITHSTVLICFLQQHNHSKLILISLVPLKKIEIEHINEHIFLHLLVIKVGLKW